jgi:hypothetical protein
MAEVFAFGLQNPAKSLDGYVLPRMALPIYVEAGMVKWGIVHCDRK